MKYSLEWLKAQVNQGYNTNNIFFWREFNGNDKVTKSCLSQWYHAPFTSKEYTFNISYYPNTGQL